MQTNPSKTCERCGREITWRRKWARDWDAVKYCGDACRRRPMNDTDEKLERRIMSLLHERRAGKTICPSEAARALGGEKWRTLMEPARRAARRLVSRGQVVITQRGKVVDPSTAKGAIRIRLT